MVAGKTEIQNGAGIHVRPSGVIYTAAREYDGTISVRFKDRETTLRSVMGLIAFGLSRGDEVEIQISGPSESEKLEEMIELFSRQYDFPPKA